MATTETSYDAQSYYSDVQECYLCDKHYYMYFSYVWYNILEEANVVIL